MELYNKEKGYKMQKERKEKLIKYLFPNEKSRKLLCEDVYFELEKVLPKNICLSYKNNNSEKRKENLAFARDKIKQFLNQNPIYLKEIENIYKGFETESLVDTLLFGYVFFLIFSSNEGELDVFLCKNSVCYSPISIIDIL